VGLVEDAHNYEMMRRNRLSFHLLRVLVTAKHLVLMAEGVPRYETMQSCRLKLPRLPLFRMVNLLLC
jgi:hypothetical protein